MKFNKKKWISKGFFFLGILFLWGCSGCGGEKEAPSESGAKQTRGLVPESVVESEDLGTLSSVVTDLPENSDLVDEDRQDDSPSSDNVGSDLGAPPAEGPESRQPAPAPQVLGPFSLQLGSFKVAASAEKLRSKLNGLGHLATVEKAEVGGVLYHRVFIRGLADRQKADQLGEDLHSRLGLSYLIRRK